jgi:hypothetical protein
MGEYDDILTKKEAKVLEEASQEMQKFQKRISKSFIALDKSKFAKMGVKKQSDFLSASIVSDYKIFSDLIKKANEYYAALKGLMDEKATTHEFITAEALSQVDIQDKIFHHALLESCMEPDKDKKLWELAYEGHFFGKVNGRKFGNFFPRVFHGSMLWFLDHLNDINETALSNYCKNFAKALGDRSNIEILGCACHYLQDLTAPHHVGNMAIFFEMMTDNTNTHYVFEKFARDFVYKKENKNRFVNPAKIIFNELKQSFNPLKSDPEKFAKAVYNIAASNVAKVKVNDRNLWTEAICDAIPLAIGATAVILEPWK